MLSCYSLDHPSLLRSRPASDRWNSKLHYSYRVGEIHVRLQIIQVGEEVLRVPARELSRQEFSAKRRGT